jgi:hypothetical protein
VLQLRGIQSKVHSPLKYKGKHVSAIIVNCLLDVCKIVSFELYHGRVCGYCDIHNRDFDFLSFTIKRKHVFGLHMLTLYSFLFTFRIFTILAFLK